MFWAGFSCQMVFLRYQHLLEEEVHKKLHLGTLSVGLLKCLLWDFSMKFFCCFFHFWFWFWSLHYLNRKVHIVWKLLKMSHLNYQILAFSTKVTCLVTLFDRKLQIFKNSPKWTTFGIFNLLLSIQNASIARFARNVEWDFFCDFQTTWSREVWIYN